MRERYGYMVLEAAHGAEALLALDDATTPVHLVLTDLVMPVMDGRALIAALVARPAAPAIIAMSGYDRPAAELTRRWVRRLTDSRRPLPSLAHMQHSSLP